MAGLVTDWVSLAQAHTNKNVAPTWQQAKKDLAFAQLKQFEEPNRKLEYWRYSDPKKLFLGEPLVSKANLVSPIVDKYKDTEVVIVRFNDNGFEVLGKCHESLSIVPIENAAEEEWVDLKMSQETVVNLANSACFNQGVWVTLSAAESVEPIKLVFDYAFSENAQWQFIRNQVQVASHCQIKINEHWSSGQCNVVNVFNLASGAQLERQQNADLEDGQKLVSFNQFQLADGATATSINQHNGGDIQHHLHRVNFNGSQANFKMGTVNKSHGKNNIADLVEINHNKKGNQSDVTHRSIADDTSQIFTNAKAYVAVGADESNIEQDLKNILLSPDAKIFSKPELEVYADEVIAAHGSTIGALDEQALFYLQSRGVDIKQAREIMIESFEQEALSC